MQPENRDISVANPTALAVVRKHISWSLTKVSAALNTALAEENDSTDLYALERHLRDALGVVARLEEVE